MAHQDRARTQGNVNPSTHRRGCQLDLAGYFALCEQGLTDGAIAQRVGITARSLGRVKYERWGIPRRARHARSLTYDGETNPPVETEWGKAYWAQGYYRLKVNKSSPLRYCPMLHLGMSFILLHRVVAFDHAFTTGNREMLARAARPWHGFYRAYYLPHEINVHHQNGNRADNRPENLVLTTRPEHMRHHWSEPGGLRKPRIVNIEKSVLVEAGA